MLNLILSATDDLPAIKLSFEHSLVALSKWEAQYEKAFFGRNEKTAEESTDYLRCMLLTEDPPLNFVERLSAKQMQEISNYINAKHTATTFGPEQTNRGPSETITSELVYYWLVQFRIPFQPTETWHLNRTMTLIKIAGLKQSKPKKMSRQEIAERNRMLNEQRRRESGSSG
jgi:hypothetical protein